VAPTRSGGPVGIKRYQQILTKGKEIAGCQERGDQGGQGDQSELKLSLKSAKVHRKAAVSRKGETIKERKHWHRRGGESVKPKRIEGNPQN
jgi:hypothetical protein